MTPLVKPGMRILRLRSDKAGPALADSLRALGAVVDDSLLYHNLPIAQAEKPDFEIVYFASASAVEVYAQQWGVESLKGKFVIAIGKPTLAALKKNNVTADLVPAEATVEASIEALAQPQPMGGSAMSPLDKLKDPWGRPFQIDPNGQHNQGMKADVFTTNPKTGQVIGNFSN